MRIPTKTLILTYLPTCTWQSAFEVLTMLEMVEADILENSVSVQLCQLANANIIDRRVTPRPFQQGRRGKLVTVEYKAKDRGVIRFRAP